MFTPKTLRAQGKGERELAAKAFNVTRHVQKYSFYVTIIGITGSASKALACLDLVAWPAGKGHYKLAG